MPSPYGGKTDKPWLKFDVPCNVDEFFVHHPDAHTDATLEYQGRLT